MSEESNARRPGRPRDPAVDRSILDATRELVLRHGVESVTTQHIAATAGVGKQTLYRRWPSKAALVLAAFVELAEESIDRPVQGPLRADLQGFLSRTFRAMAETGPALRSLMAMAQRDPGFREALRTGLIEPRRDSLRGLLAAAAARGELTAGADREGVVMALYGAVWYRLLLGETLDDGLARRLTELAVRTLCAGAD